MGWALWQFSLKLHWKSKCLEHKFYLPTNNQQLADKWFLVVWWGAHAISGAGKSQGSMTASKCN